MFDYYRPSLKKWCSIIIDPKKLDIILNEIVFCRFTKEYIDRYFTGEFPKDKSYIFCEIRKYINMLIDLNK